VAGGCGGSGCSEERERESMRERACERERARERDRVELHRRWHEDEEGFVNFEP